jgi:hypothetical protein
MEALLSAVLLNALALGAGIGAALGALLVGDLGVALTMIADNRMQ